MEGPVLSHVQQLRFHDNEDLIQLYFYHFMEIAAENHFIGIDFKLSLEVSKVSINEESLFERTTVFLAR